MVLLILVDQIPDEFEVSELILVEAFPDQKRVNNGRCSLAFGFVVNLRRQALQQELARVRQESDGTEQIQRLLQPYRSGLLWLTGNVLSHSYAAHALAFEDA